MIIAIDGYEANTSSRVGIGRYAHEIVRHIYTLLQSQSRPDHVRIYVPSPPRADMPPQTSWWRYCMRGPSRLWTLVGLPFALLVDQPRADVIFTPTHYSPRFIPIPRVISIMDVSYLTFPDLFKPKDLHQLVHWTKYSVLRASRILTISEFSKRAIIEAYHIPQERVVVTYPGFTMADSFQETSEQVRKKYNLHNAFILSVGTIQPRKNFARLIEAFSQLTKAGKAVKNIELVIVGKKGWLYEDILKAPARYDVEERVHFLDYVPDTDLPALYESAVCFVLPSLYEGFGLPVLEAMAYGCPVVVSNTSSLPEIAGKAGIYIDPQSVESIAHGIVQAIGERTSKKGAIRIGLARQRVKDFTWQKAAKQTLRVLEEVGGKHV